MGRIFACYQANWLSLALGLFGLILFIYSSIAFFGSASNKSDIAFEPAKSASDNTQTQINTQNIIVDVKGAIVKPGIYSLKQGARVQEVLVLASGLSENADRNWVEKNLNLVAKLSDGAKIYIPKIGEVQNSTTNVVQGVNSRTDVAIPNALIDVSNASTAELDTLPE